MDVFVKEFGTMQGVGMDQERTAGNKSFGTDDFWFMEFSKTPQYD